MTGETLVAKLLSEVSVQRAKMVKEHCRTDEDMIAVATVFATQAYVIWRKMGGEKMAAKQFQAWSDLCVTRTAKQTIYLMIAASFLIGVIVGASAQ